MGETTSDAMLETVLAALAEGREPDLAALAERYPGRTAEIERLLGTARLYARATGAWAKTGSRARYLEPGQHVGDFEIVDFLGSGGMGQVYRARQLSLGRREVALKVAPAWLQSDEGKGRFQREGLLLAGLHHPSLAEVYGIGEADGLLFLAMRLVEGETLEAVRDRTAPAGGPPDASARRRIVGWGADLASALGLVHASGLVHRDVKPSNVVIEGAAPGGRAVLVDFGLVRPRSADTLTRAGAPATPHYAAPEQILGGEVSPRSDVFALGATLHDLLTGRSPEDRRPASAGLERLDALLPDVDLDLVAIVGRAVDPQARWRYADAEELRADLAAWLAGGPVAARRRPLGERLRRGITERPERAARLVLATGLVVVLLAAFQRVSQYRSAAVEAARAHARGDLLGMALSVERVPAPLLGVLTEEAIRAPLRRLAAARSDDALVDVVRLLEADDTAEALEVAATRLRVDGPAHDPWIAWFFESSLRHLLDDPRAARDVRSDAIRLAARLCYERPVETPADVRATAGLRELLRDAWVDPELPEMDRLYALSALGGCGTGADLGPILRGTLGDERSRELRRLGQSAATWILMRSGSIGEPSAAELDAALEAYRPHLERVLDTAREEWWSPAPMDLAVLGTKLLLPHLGRAERRATGRASTLIESLPTAWADLDERGPRGTWVTGVMAHLGDPRARERILRWAPTSRPDPDEEPRYYRFWGLLTGGAEDRELAAAVSARCRALAAGRGDEAELVAAFDEGLRRAAAAGIPDNFRLDEDTLLGREHDGPDPVALELAPGEAPDGVAAAWDFRSAPHRGLGAARAAIAVGAGTGTDEGGLPYLRMGRFGTSTVSLEFDLAGDPLELEDQPLLVLQHMAARRDVYPFHGQAFLDVRLNDLAVIEKLPVQIHHPSFPDNPPVLVPHELLRPGRNVLSLRLHPATTTTYRLLRAELRWGE